MLDNLLFLTTATVTERKQTVEVQNYFEQKKKKHKGETQVLLSIMNHVQCVWAWRSLSSSNPLELKWSLSYSLFSHIQNVHMQTLPLPISLHDTNKVPTSQETQRIWLWSTFLTPRPWTPHRNREGRQGAGHWTFSSFPPFLSSFRGNELFCTFKDYYYTFVVVCVPSTRQKKGLMSWESFTARLSLLYFFRFRNSSSI